MIKVAEAERIIQMQHRDFGVETIEFDKCPGRILAENILADRDFPPFDRVTMDGIAIRFCAFKNGQRSFHIRATQSAGETPIDIESDSECMEIMTGAALPATTDTVIPYEHIKIQDQTATIHNDSLLPGQNIHSKGRDKKQGEVLVEANQFITPVILSVAAAVGKTKLSVKKFPKVMIISTGDELVEIDQAPAPFQIRRSNNYSLRAALKQFSIDAAMLHLPDDPVVMEAELRQSIDQFDIILLSGGVSMGKFDFLPAAFEKIGVEKLFHKVQQRPGKPFWFGAHPNKAIVFAFPGNPVSTFMCFHRYFLSWLKSCWQLKEIRMHAILDADFSFQPALQYFLQVALQVNDKGQWLAKPVEGHGSGDFANLIDADAFMELPLELNDFKQGEVFPVWPFKQMTS